MSIIRLNESDLKSLSKDDLIRKHLELQNCLDSLETSDKLKSFEIVKLKNLLLMKYQLNNSAFCKDSSSSSQQHQQQNVAESATEDALSPNKKRIATPATTASLSNRLLSNSLVDPCVNSLIEQLKHELNECRRERDDLRNELTGIRFNAENNTGKRLVLKCRKLLQENEELGKMISSGNLAKLEADLAYHKALLNEACENEQNLNLFVSELDNEMDTMQATIIQLQQIISRKFSAQQQAATTVTTSSSSSQ